VGTIVDDCSVSEDLSRAAQDSDKFLSRCEEILNPVPRPEPITLGSISFESLKVRAPGLVVGMLQPESGQDEASSPLLLGSAGRICPS
jgi:hypothetical protein